FGQIVSGADPEIDMIVSGHTHLAYNHDVPIPGTDRTRPVISSGQYGEKYAHSRIVFDPATGEFTIDTEVLDLAGFEPDPEVAQIVQDAVGVAKELGAVSLGSITEDIPRGVQSSGSENRGSESPLGNLVADAQLAAAADLGAQIAIMNPGGIRGNLVYASSGANDPDGNVTYAEAAAIQPFANTLVTINLTGAQLKEVLEQQWQPAGEPRPFLKLGVSEGFEYVYDPNLPQGERILAMSLNGEPIDAATSYKVVANSFLAAGGDAFTAFQQGTGKVDSGRIDLDAFVAYIGANSPVTARFEQRSVGVALSAPANGTAYEQGEQVTAQLSSLLFSAGGPRDGEAAISIGDAVLGSAPITFQIVDTRDEQGTATI